MWLIILILLIPCCVWRCCSIKKSNSYRCSNKCLNCMLYGNFLRTLLETHIELLLVGAINIYGVSFSTYSDALSFSFSLFMVVSHSRLILDHHALSSFSAHQRPFSRLASTYQQEILRKIWSSLHGSRLQTRLLPSRLYCCIRTPTHLCSLGSNSLNWLPLHSDFATHRSHSLEALLSSRSEAILSSK